MKDAERAALGVEVLAVNTLKFPLLCDAEKVRYIHEDDVETLRLAGYSVWFSSADSEETVAGKFVRLIGIGRNGVEVSPEVWPEV